MWRSIYRRLRSNLGCTEAEVDAMPWSEASDLFDLWNECPPAAESLARIAEGLGVWKRPSAVKAKPRVSTEQELVAFALFGGRR